MSAPWWRSARSLVAVYHAVRRRSEASTLPKKPLGFLLSFQHEGREGRLKVGE